MSVGDGKAVAQVFEIKQRCQDRKLKVTILKYTELFDSKMKNTF